mmetsp:Transcript_535/g.1258  ORF Transcript_535/g.1258 Transcript_535/m.1258 type:complete len:557 (-) Transcript_535:110-1780(-)
MPPVCTSGIEVSQFRRSMNSRVASGGFARGSRSAIGVSLRPEHRGLVLACSVLFASTAIQSSTCVEAFSTMPGGRMSSSYRCTGSLARMPSSRLNTSCNRIARPWRRPLDRQPLGEQYSLSKRYASTGSTAEYTSGGDDDDDDDDDDSKSSGNTRKRRPDWAPSWAPTSLVTMRPILQLFVGLVLYIFHLLVLTQHQLVFPVQLIPNDRGWFQSLGLDSLAGMFSLAFMLHLRKTTKGKATPAVPPVFRSPKENEAPWRFPSSARNGSKSIASTSSSDSSKAGLTPKATSLVVFLLLTYTYFNTGRFSLFCERFLYDLAGVGVPMTVAMHRSLVVLLGHLGWVAAGSTILRFALRPQPFFGGGWIRPGWRQRIAGVFDRTRSPRGEEKKRKQPAEVKWYTNQWDTYWLWWTIGGYFVSSWVFNIADFVNQCALPAAIFEAQPEGVVSQLINPENNDIAASLMGYIAPCISAPWWEEVLYRGFMLPALCLHLGYWPAVYVSGIIFSAHHMSWTGGIPLAFLGWTWAAIYAKCGNLLVTILIHAMWNSRVFLGSWLGL